MGWDILRENYMNVISSAAGMGAAAGAFFGVLVVVGLIVVVMEVIANWKLFEKANEEGWKSIIPIYSTYTRYKLSWNVKAFFVLAVISILYVLIYPGNSEAGFLYICSKILYFIIIIIEAMSMVKLSKAFGCSNGFAIGLVLLRPIFMMILGFGKYEYVGADTSLLFENSPETKNQTSNNPELDTVIAESQNNDQDNQKTE